MAALKFLGASVRNYSTSLGWDNQESRLQVALVEDFKDGDLFLLSNNFYQEGLPTVFNHGSMSFGGIIQSWRQTNDLGGNPVYEVSVVDPRIIFDGIQLILNEYTKPVAVKNLVNIYGYLEDKNGFGGSQANGAGIPFNLIRSALLDLAFNASPSQFCGGINYNNIEYNIDLSELPILPEDYRISATNLSLSELIAEICDIMSCSYFVRLYYTSNKWYIKVFTQSRSIKPYRGAIRNFINTIGTGVVMKEIGTELVNEVTTKYLVGGKKSDIYINTFNPGRDNDYYDSDDNGIWYYFGTDLDGNCVFTRSRFLNFEIDSRNINKVAKGIGTKYKTNLLELRAALTSYDSWLELIKMMWPFEFIPEIDGSETDYIKIIGYTPEQKADITSLESEIKFCKARIIEVQDEINKIDYGFSETDVEAGQRQARSLQILINGLQTDMKKAKEALAKITKGVVDGTKRYKHNGIENPHYMKAINFDIRDISNGLMFWTSIDGMKNYTELNNNVLQKWTKVDDTQKQELSPIEELYQLVVQFAENYYGKKFMVKVPEVKGTTEPDSTTRRTNHIPVSAGYVPENEWANAIKNKILPQEYLQFTNENNQIVSYVRFDNATELDLSIFDKNDLSYTTDSKGTSVFIRCEIEPEYVYENYQRFTNPRAIITLPAPIYKKKINAKLLDYLLTIISRNILETELTIPQIQDMTRDQLITTCKNRGYFVDENSVINIPAGLRIVSDTTDVQLQNFTIDSYNAEKAQLEQAMGAGAFSTTLNSEFTKEAIFPSMAAIPIESQVDFYGPWISSLGNGKVEFEQNTDIVPWNFNSYTDMDAYGQALVNGISGNMTWSELGSFEVPGTPLLSPGDSLIVGGPILSDMEVSINDNKISTTYRVSSWVPRFGKLSRHMAERIQTISKIKQESIRYARYYSTLKGN